MIPLGNIVSKLRYERKFTQDQLSKKIGAKSSSTIAAYEAGTRFPSLTNLIALSQVFGVTTDYLLGISDKRTHYLDVSGLTPRQIDSLELIIENYRECNTAADKGSEE